jgi:hypothetical protein
MLSTPAVWVPVRYNITHHDYIANHYIKAEVYPANPRSSLCKLSVAKIAEDVLHTQVNNEIKTEVFDDKPEAA